MVAKIATYVTVADFEKVAQSIIRANGRNRTLMQEASVAALEHMLEHGDYTVMLPLALASLTFGHNQQQAWIYFMEGHSWLKHNPRGLKGRALTGAEVKDLWAKDKNAKPEALSDASIERAKSINWWEAKRPAMPAEVRNVNAPDAIAKFRDRLVKALVSETLMGADDKPVSLDTLRKMLDSLVSQVEADAKKALDEKINNSHVAPTVDTSKSDAKAAA